MSSNNQQFTAGSMASDLDHLTRCFSALLSENRLMNANLIHPYDGQESINHWLRLFEVHAERWCMTDEMKFVHITKYLPAEITAWIARVPTITTWPSLKVALIDTFGIHPAKDKILCKKRLESLRQGNIPSRRFKSLFHAAVMDFPEGYELSDDHLRTIYLKCMSPALRSLVLPNVSADDSWRDVANSAIEREDTIGLDESLC